MPYQASSKLHSVGSTTELCCVTQRNLQGRRWGRSTTTSCSPPCVTSSLTWSSCQRQPSHSSLCICHCYVHLFRWPSGNRLPPWFKNCSWWNSQLIPAFTSSSLAQFAKAECTRNMNVQCAFFSFDQPDKRKFPGGDAVFGLRSALPG